MYVYSRERAAAAKSLQSCLTLCNPRWQPTRLPHPQDSPGKNTGVGCHFLLQCMKVKNESEVVQLCPTLGDLMDCSLPGSSVHGIFQTRILEWGSKGNRVNGRTEKHQKRNSEAWYHLVKECLLSIKKKLSVTTTTINVTYPDRKNSMANNWWKTYPECSIINLPVIHIKLSKYKCKVFKNVIDQGLN